MAKQAVRIDGSIENMHVVIRYSDGSNSVQPSRIVNEQGLRRVLKRAAKFYGMTIAPNGLSATKPE